MSWVKIGDFEENAEAIKVARRKMDKEFFPNALI